MKILVTGGAGFVGSNLIERLLNEGNEIVSLDNYFTGRKENHINGATYIEGETKDVSQKIDFNPEVIFHLGEYSRVEQSFDDWDKIREFNILGTTKVLEFAKDSNAKLIYAGSSTKFGDQGLARDETPYAWSKASNTELVNNFGKWYGLKYAITYFYNVYGRREIEEGKYATVVAKFLNLKKRGEPLSVYAPGNQIRYFTHIDDIIDGLILVSEKGEGDEFGLGSTRGYSILELAQLIDKDNVKMMPEVRGNRMDSPVNISKSTELGWSAKRNLEDYIKSKLEN